MALELASHGTEVEQRFSACSRNHATCTQRAGASHIHPQRDHIPGCVRIPGCVGRIGSGAARAASLVPPRTSSARTPALRARPRSSGSQGDSRCTAPRRRPSASAAPLHLPGDLAREGHTYVPLAHVASRRAVPRRASRCAVGSNLTKQDLQAEGRREALRHPAPRSRRRMDAPDSACSCSYMARRPMGRAGPRTALR